MALSPGRDSKSLLTYDFHPTVEIEEFPITIENNSSLTSRVNFLNGVYNDPTNGTLTSSITALNTINTDTNSASRISYTGLYNHAINFLYQNNQIIKDKISDKDNTDSLFIREITLPIKDFKADRIKKGSFKISLQKNPNQYSRYLSINNNSKYNDGQNAAFVYLNDDQWVKGLTGTASAFAMCFNFRLNNDWNRNMTASSMTQYLIYKSTIWPRPDSDVYDFMDWTICSSAIPLSLSYQRAYLEKFDHTAAPYYLANHEHILYGLRLTYYSATANHSLSGKFVFETILAAAGQDYVFPAINSGAILNSQTAALSGLTSNKNLVDGNWHQLIWSRNFLDSPTTETAGAIYLDGVRLKPYQHFSGAWAAEYYTARYEMVGKTIETTTPIVLGAKISPIDSQVTMPHFNITEAKNSTINQFIVDPIKIEPEYNIGTSPLTAYDRGLYIEGLPLSAQSLYTSGSNTNIFSYFGSTNIEQFLVAKNCSQTSDKIPNNKSSLSESDVKQLNTALVSSQKGTHGFNGDIASFYLWDQSIENLNTTISGATSVKVAECVNLSASFSGNLIYQQYLQKEPITDLSLKGSYQFFKEDYSAVTVKNRIYSNEKKYVNIENEQYGYFGAGVFINHNDFKKNTVLAPNLSIKNETDFFDIPETIFTTNLNHGRIVYVDSSKNLKDCGVIFYDLGIVVFDSNISLTNAITGSLLSSISSNARLQFTTPPNLEVEVDDSSNFYIDEIYYAVEKIKYANYIDINIDSDEFNQSTNPTNFSRQEFSYPTTISFYNDRNECLYVSKINQLIEKNKFLHLKYKPKISF